MNVITVILWTVVSIRQCPDSQPGNLREILPSCGVFLFIAVFTSVHHSYAGFCLHVMTLMSMIYYCLYLTCLIWFGTMLAAQSGTKYSLILPSGRA